MVETAGQYITRKDQEFRADPHVSRGLHGGSRERGIREAWTFLPQSDFEDCVFLAQRIRWASGVQYRLGYCILREDGNWAEAAYHPDFPALDIPALIRKAIGDGTFLREDWTGFKIEP